MDLSLMDIPGGFSLIEDADTVVMHQETVRKLLAGYRPAGTDPDDRNTTWIPSERNPSKLIQHHWNGYEWKTCSTARFVTWKLMPNV